MNKTDVLVVGGGSAGMAAALAARECGAERILVVERSPRLGGILRQCIHNGFGIHKFQEDLTGTEYAKRYTVRIADAEIPFLTDTFVLGITSDLEVTVMNSARGIQKIRAGSVVLAMGCRERSRGALLIPGTRPAGVFSAGTAQRYLNLEGYLPGKEMVILGSGDIGLIMARQFTLEGARVREVVEIMPHSSGLARNISQCLHDFNIPLSYNSTIVNIAGAGRVESVTVAKVDADRRPISGTERVIPCDTLLISAGLIPENELSRETGVDISRKTKGAIVDDSFHTSIPGIFSCGNVLHVHDLVDNVSLESEIAGGNAALFVQNRLHTPTQSDCIPVQDGQGVTGTVPQFIRTKGEEENIRLMFRPTRVFQNHRVCVYSGERKVKSQKFLILAPGEMADIAVSRSDLLSGGGPVTIQVEE